MDLHKSCIPPPSFCYSVAWFCTLPHIHDQIHRTIGAFDKYYQIRTEHIIIFMSLMTLNVSRFESRIKCEPCNPNLEWEIPPHVPRQFLLLHVLLVFWIISQRRCYPIYCQLYKISLQNYPWLSVGSSVWKPASIFAFPVMFTFPPITLHVSRALCCSFPSFKEK